jgi:hypothetical protein
MENTLYYTFSTIAQVLAGAIALLGAFILYRLQKLNNGLDDHAKFIRKQYSEEDDLVFLNSFIVKGEYKKFLKYSAAKPIAAGSDQDEEQSYLTDVQAKMRELLVLRKSLIRRFTVSLLLTVTLIGSSVIALAVTPSLNARSDVRSASLGVAIVWFLACLISYVSLLRKSLF